MSRRRQRKRTHNGERLVSGSLLFRRWTSATLAAIALLAIALVGGLLLYNPLSGGGPSPVLKAAIVDQVSVYDQNPAFVAAVTDLLEGAGYAVDYYPGEEVTVDFYRDFGTHGYDLIVLRAHSSLPVWQGRPVDEVVLFTSEPYSLTKYRDEQEAALARVRYHKGGDAYFGLRAEFVTSRMQGSFQEATIILMGCDGLQSQTTAQAFLDKGASAFVSWTDSITWDHSDAATERLLELMLIDGLDAVAAVKQTAAELGPDPVFGAELRILTRGG